MALLLHSGAMQITDLPSPNFNQRRDVARPDMVVLHYTAMETPDAACARLCDPLHEVSAHYLISETGEIVRLVEERQRAWHAGRSQWGEVRDVNSHSIGIELANFATPDCLPEFPEEQMVALELLLIGLLDRLSIGPERVVGHSDIAPDRKADPGPMFDWKRLAAGKLAVWPGHSEAGDFLRDLGVVGYRAQGQGEPEAELLAAFRLRYRPGVSGQLDDTDRAMAAALARDYPCVDPEPFTS